MTLEEYNKRKKITLNKIDEALKKVFKGQIKQEEYLLIRKEWTDLINDVKKEPWFKHI